MAASTEFDAAGTQNCSICAGLSMDASGQGLLLFFLLKMLAVGKT